ncbi:MAG: MarR family winged helix-turn-helix transcriptional regulator [Alphaproteobacteria bacterium]
MSMVTARACGGTAVLRRRKLLPPSVTLAALLEGGSDAAFRALVQDILVMAKELQELRAALARALGVSEPQYRVVLAVAQLARTAGAGVSQVADYLRVSGAFVTMETRSLVRRGLVAKHADPLDGRAVLLSLTKKGRRSLARLAAHQQAVNNELSRDFSAAEFHRLSGFGRRLVANAERARRASAALARGD